MFTTMNHTWLLRTSGVLIALALLASACKSTPTPAQGSVTLDVSGVAANYSSETVAAVPASSGGPAFEVMPQYERLTLAGYPVTKHLLTPQIFVFPANELAAANELAGQQLAGLQALLGNQREGEILPFLPLYNAAQDMHAQVKYLDFGSGKGVRYLTQFDQGRMPINNRELIYTFQGLTTDGKYYVSAVLPVNLPSLPADSAVDVSTLPDFTSDYQKYVSNVVSTLNEQGASAFTPDLAKLDAMVESITVK